MNLEPHEEEMAKIIWETSRADEQSVSAIGANFIAKALSRAGYGPISQEAPSSATGEAPWQVGPGRIELIPAPPAPAGGPTFIPPGYALVNGNLVALWP